MVIGRSKQPYFCFQISNTAEIKMLMLSLGHRIHKHGDWCCLVCCHPLYTVYGCNRNAFLISGCRMRGAGYNYVFTCSDQSIPSDSMKLNKIINVLFIPSRAEHQFQDFRKSGQQSIEVQLHVTFQSLHSLDVRVLALHWNFFSSPGLRWAPAAHQSLWVSQAGSWVSRSCCTRRTCRTLLSRTSRTVRSCPHRTICSMLTRQVHSCSTWRITHVVFLSPSPSYCLRPHWQTVTSEMLALSVNCGVFFGRLPSGSQRYLDKPFRSHFCNRWAVDNWKTHFGRGVLCQPCNLNYLKMQVFFSLIFFNH